MTTDKVAMRDKAVPLSLGTLDDLPETVVRPNYDRKSLSAGIVHFGVGNFHRAHQGVYLDALMNDGRDHNWAVIGASVMPGDARVRDLLMKQDWLGSVTAQSATGSDARVTGVMIDYLPPADSAAILATLEHPEIRIVSLTVTEGGYFVDADTGLFDDQHPAIQADVSNFDSPSTVFGLIVRALRTRRNEGHQAFTVMSCDNLPHNGVVTRRAVVGLAQLIEPALAMWIDAHSSFPNGMVDRIAPATGDRERSLVVDKIGIGDAAPVFCEDYLQWVLEDKFVDGRPRLEEVGVQFVDDVTPFETMKIRILNGGHALIAYPAGLLDIEGSGEAMAHPLIRGFLDKVELEEILPIVPPVPDTNLEDYYKIILSRFSNPHVVDTIRRLCLDGSNRQPKFIVPSIVDRTTNRQRVEGLALASALWCRYCFGKTESGAIIEPNDPSWDHLVERAHAARTDPGAWLGMRDIYGELAHVMLFKKPFTQALDALWAEGTESVLQRYLDGTLFALPDHSHR
ncbi:mannitol dehydrogenase family protein [Granulosicoccus antarcticus]|uniref:Mannitol 2-dehydrogenase n=1 Tax=Granulosicoccus antarcticus IMCC3135 TaxID=1192854 RepID=A0A2Z2NUF8_9GAMM|nr:mannitol dehydrogenase family protein [Granulosicoccus antarcticus]ASJ73671.1 Mannitol 2-dehydrogenase [Granulosicoccus antarcticus IMCC3135]